MLVADLPPPYASTAITYADGAVAEARTECAVLDLCATIRLPDQDVLQIYNMGAGRCQPFILHLVRTRGAAVVMESNLVTATTTSPSSYTESPQPNASTPPAKRQHGPIPPPGQHCARFANTYYSFDAGRIRMGVFLARDGALFVQFAPPK
jgi:hypothetical protein